MEGEYSPEAVEEKWQEKWVENQTYKYSGSSDNEEVFSIDTPPPTVSGSLHMGHLYGQTLQDFQARFQRMRGKKVFQPFGYDDNGIASERLTESELGIRHQDFTRREFQEKCREVCQEYEEKFTNNMQSLGISHDWTNTYKTIEPRVQRISQLSFIDLYEKDREYRKKAPAIWCPECETAISQVETEDAERDSHFNDIEFELATGNGSIIISTTRPELIPACVAIFVHPEDETNDNLVGEKAEVPLFGHEVPIIEDERVDMEKGSGVVMCCTFGDQTDIEWYQAHDLDLKVAIDESGTMTELAGKYEGMSTHEAREAIVEDLDDEGLLLDREAITHDVQVHERCDEDIEFRVTEQWYIKLLDRKEKYLDAGEQMDWFPEKMHTRYEHWIEGLEWDWCISRQRDSGIPFPVWYCKDCGEEIVAEKENLPVDPIEDEPPVHECPECGGEEFRAEEDVFDTWATSSLTPLINAHWDWDEQDEEFEMGREELYPFNLRPEGHDIISFWLFHTVVKCYEHTGEVPFQSTMNHGHVLDEHREKMSKSKGNVVAPAEVLEEFPVDAARYWAAGSKVGNDFPFKEKELESGEKLMRKIWNASKLVDQLTEENPKKPENLEEIDAWMLAEQDELIEDLTEQMENYEFSKARDELRSFFWDTFCGDYLEITKQRLDAEESQSAQYTLRTAHRKFIKLFAPLLSHITEEIWNEMYSGNSIHTSSWPETSGEDADLEAGENAMQVISALRKYKSSNQMSLNEEIEHVQIFGNISGMDEAIKEVMHVQELENLEEEPETEKKVVEISLDYSKAGPKYGDKVGEIEEALENEEWMLDGARLEVAGEHLKAEEFEVREEVTYTGEGEMLETDGCIIIIQ
ncbi:valine--tRNA ligase [Candidatus Nanohalobium constans]|uniref:Valine--tRNA ligase n=1 Tax=Candidatus Nanohalobium constans TaxID=2565781 RepID=A0A5Q0UFA5_9ARCH|nr:valine--tRNA ligase [Candidatus Nanohalobium constans]QGA80282.1 valyl-tRNA synthetase [Candidatus Nanohalobium constans]